MQEYEKQLINWVISKLKRNRLPVSEMVLKLKTKNPELGEYAESIEHKINGSMQNEYKILFQESLVNACMSTPDPQQAAKNFFNAVGLVGGSQYDIIKAIKERIK